MTFDCVHQQTNPSRAIFCVRRKCLRQSLQQISRDQRMFAHLSRITSPARPCKWTAVITAESASLLFGCCAIIPATIPVRISPVPPVDIPGLPVVFTHASLSDCTTRVRCPFSTTINSCSRANFRATPNRSCCTSAIVHPTRRAISPGCGVITSVRPLPLNQLGTILERIQAISIDHHWRLAFSYQGPHQFRRFRITGNAWPNREDGLAFYEFAVFFAGCGRDRSGKCFRQRFSHQLRMESGHRRQRRFAVATVDKARAHAQHRHSSHRHRTSFPGDPPITSTCP